MDAYWEDAYWEFVVNCKSSKNIAKVTREIAKLKSEGVEPTIRQVKLIIARATK